MGLQPVIHCTAKLIFIVLFQEILSKKYIWILDKNPDLSRSWNNCDAIQLALNYGSKYKILECSIVLLKDAVKYSDFLIGEHCAEVKSIHKAVRAMFHYISKQFANTPALSYFAYKYELSGSVRDKRKKVFGPT